MHTILVLEDDIELNNTICCSLEKNGYRVMGARTCEEAKNYANSYTFHMAILDINLPDGNGFQFCKWLKARSNTLILFLSAKDLETDILNGYELGADDYVTKPFSMRILLKKVYVILSRKSQEANIYDDGFLKVDFELGIVQQGVNECLLSPTEYRILKKLIENKGKLLTYSVLLDSLWDEGVQITDKHFTVSRERRFTPSSTGPLNWPMCQSAVCNTFITFPSLSLLIPLISDKEY